MKHSAPIAIETTLDRNRTTDAKAVTEVAAVRLLSEERALPASLVDASRGPTERTTP
jgi:hypothetical protein